MISKKVWWQIKEDFQWRCAYCQMPAVYLPQGLEKEHIIPRSLGGSDMANNICPACPNCNAHKLKKVSSTDPESDEKVRLFNPYRDKWTDHFEWDKTGTKILGRTKIGRGTVAALKMNLPEIIAWRRIIVKIGGYPPKLT